MLRLPAQATYAMLALVRLAQAPGQRATVASLAAAHDMPGPFLLTIMGRLRAAGYVASARGRRGGYVLMRDPATITLADVIDELDGHAEAQVIDGSARRSTQRALLSAVDEAMRRSLGEITVASLALSERDAEVRPAG